MPRLAAAALAVLIAASVLGVTAPAAAKLPKPEPGAPASVVISEVANGDAASADNSFVELRNTGDAVVDLRGWKLYRCSEIGLRRNSGNTEGDLSGRVLQPGGSSPRDCRGATRQKATSSSTVAFQYEKTIATEGFLVCGNSTSAAGQRAMR